MIHIARGSARPERDGFSLVELVYVLIIVGIMAAMAYPRIDFQRSHIDSAARRVNSFVLIAQRTAVLRQHDVRLSFDADQGRFVLHQDANNNGIVDASETQRVEVLDDGVTFGVAGDFFTADAEAVTFDLDSDGLPSLVFHRNGSASEEGVVHIGWGQLTEVEYDRAVHVTRATGLPRCWSKRTGEWLEGC